MIEVHFTEEEIEHTYTKAAAMGVFKGSILRGKGNKTGLLGEAAFSKYKPSAGYVNEFSHDFVSNGLRIDVKSKECSYTPKPNYCINVNAIQKDQQCDVYVFAQVYKDHSKAWLVGWEYKEEYFKKAKLWRAGETDPKNGHTYKADCYNVELQQLRKLT